MEISQSYIKLILGLKIRQLRTEKGLSLSELAKKCGMSVSYLNEIESGKKYPKSEKIALLASALDITYDKLVSLKLTKQLAPIGDLLESNILEKLPLDHYGIDLNKFISLMSSASLQLSALVSTIIDLAKSSEMSENNFSRTALRTYKEINDNYFSELEDSVDDFCGKFNVFCENPIKYKKLTSILEMEYDYSIDDVSMSQFPELRNIRAYVKKDEGKKLFLNPNLSDEQKLFIVAKELAYNFLEVKDRSYIYSSLALDNFDHLLNNFRSSYWANALIINKELFKLDLQKFFSLKKWRGELLIKFLKKYHTSPEMLFQRISNLAPKYLGLNKYFFIRFNSRIDSDDYHLSKEVRLNIRRNPGGYQSIEHYCRRWISIENLKKLKSRILLGEDVDILPGIIHSNFHNSSDDFIAISMSKASRFLTGNLYSVTIGFLLDDFSKDKIKFSEDKSIPYQIVNDTCESCGIMDCEERVAPPITLERKEQLRNLRRAVSELK